MVIEAGKNCKVSIKPPTYHYVCAVFPMEIVFAFAK